MSELQRPTQDQLLTRRQFLRLAAQAAGEKVKQTLVPGLFVAGGGLFLAACSQQDAQRRIQDEVKPKAIEVTYPTPKKEQYAEFADLATDHINWHLNPDVLQQIRDMGGPRSSRQILYRHTVFKAEHFGLKEDEVDRQYLLGDPNRGIDDYLMDISIRIDGSGNTLHTTQQFAVNDSGKMIPVEEGIFFDKGYSFDEMRNLAKQTFQDQSLKWEQPDGLSYIQASKIENGVKITYEVHTGGFMRITSIPVKP